MPQIPFHFLPGIGVFHRALVSQRCINILRHCCFHFICLDTFVVHFDIDIKRNLWILHLDRAKETTCLFGLQYNTICFFLNKEFITQTILGLKTCRARSFGRCPLHSIIGRTTRRGIHHALIKFKPVKSFLLIIINIYLFKNICIFSRCSRINKL